MNKNRVILFAALMSLSAAAYTSSDNASHDAEASHDNGHAASPVSDDLIAEQRAKLEENTRFKGFGPQSPRNIDNKEGQNHIVFSNSPAMSKMNLCNIHFHKNAEHAGGEFTTYAGNGDGHGFQSGYRYNGQLSSAELTPVSGKICPSEHGDLKVGDTIEVHYVYSTAQIVPGQTLGACLNEDIGNPQLRVEAQVFVLVNDENAADFNQMTQYDVRDGYFQATDIPSNSGTPVIYAGSTTGPKYNEQGSPFEVTWSVRPKVVKVNASSVGKWCEGNTFKEDHAHGVRNLVINPKLLSPIE